MKEAVFKGTVLIVVLTIITWILSIIATKIALLFSGIIITLLIGALVLQRFNTPKRPKSQYKL